MPNTVDVSAEIVKWAGWCVANKESFEYAETRPMPLTTKPQIRNDCSGTVTLCYKLAGAPDPNGLGYSGQGYTGTLVDHGKQISLAQVKPGDVVIYGPGEGVHCAVVTAAGTDPLTMSHGMPSEPGFVYVSRGCPAKALGVVRYFRYDTTAPAPPAPIAPKPVPAPKPAPKIPPPSAENLEENNLVGMHNVAEATLALKNGWTLWYWTNGENKQKPFMPQKKGQPTGVTLYANKDYTQKRSKLAQIVKKK